MKLAWTPQSLEDRRTIYDYIVHRNAGAALVLDELFSAQLARLVDHPESGRAGRLGGTRELVVHKNYVVIYDLTNAEVRVLRILHSTRQCP